MRSIHVLGMLATLTVALAACGGGGAGQSTASGARPAPHGEGTAAVATERVRIGYSSLSLTVLTSLLAQSQGFYAAQGIEAELQQVAPQASLAALTVGELDYVMSLGSLVRAAAKGLPIRLVEASLRAPQFVLVSQPSVNTVADLRGGIIGVTSRGGTNEQTAQFFVQAAGLDAARDVQMLAIGEEGQLWESLRLGRVQAIPVAPPFPVLAEREGYRLLGNAAEQFSLPATGVGTSAAKLAEKREQVRRVTAAEIQALRYIRAEREATVAFIAQRFNMEPDMAARSYELVLPSFSADGRLPREGLQLLLELDLAAGALTELPPLESIADFALVDEALPLLDK